MSNFSLGDGAKRDRLIDGFLRDPGSCRDDRQG
jgi:hypothetical protein